MPDGLYQPMPRSPVAYLVNAINAGVTTIEVAPIASLPDPPNIATIGAGEDSETIKYTGKAGNNLTGVTRGFEGDARAWNAGVPIANVPCAQHITALHEAVRRNNLQEVAVPFVSTGSKTYYIDAVSGNDNNNGESAGQAFSTWAKAVSMLPRVVLHDHGYIFRIIGHFTGAIIVTGRTIAGSLIIRGDTDVTENHIVTGTLRVQACVPSYIDSITVRNLQFTDQMLIYGTQGVYINLCNPRGTHAAGAIFASNSVALVRDCAFGTSVVTRAIAVDYGANVTSRDNTGNATQFGLAALGGGVIAKWTGTTQPTGTSANEFALRGGVIR